MCTVMAQERMNREQFFTKLGGFDEEELRKMVWTLYWRGTATMKDRVEDLLEPKKKFDRQQAAHAPPDARVVLAEVREFAQLARAGAYLAGDRRVSPKERTRWRVTFRGLTAQAQEALLGDDVESAAAALATMIDLACESRGLDYFRSQDPMEAARFVVSDAVEVMWSRMREVYAPRTFADKVSTQLLRWESRYGWTRHGDGWVAEREMSLATVLTRLLTVPDLWTEVAQRYLEALDRTPAGSRTRRPAADLTEWHTLLAEHLTGTDEVELLDRIATLPGVPRA